MPTGPTRRERDRPARRPRLALAAMLGAAACPAALAEPPARQDDVQRQLDDMRSEIERLRESNARMLSEMDELRRINDDLWLDEHRAEEIRAIVHDVLADADTRASLLQAAPMAGWNPESGFYLQSGDGRFFLGLDGQLQFRWMMNYHDVPDRWQQGFEISRAKLTFRGHVFSRDITYLVRTDVTRNEPGLVTGLDFLQDAWVRWQVNNEWSVRAGQFKLPFNREELVSSARQLAVERSLINENMNIGRTQGVEFLYADGISKFYAATGDGATDTLAGNAGLTNSMPLNSPAIQSDVEWAATGRYEFLVSGSWEQFEDFTSPSGDEFGLLLGAAVHGQAGENGSPGPTEYDWFGFTVDASAEWGGANAFVAFMYHQVDTPALLVDLYGVVAQGGIYFDPKWEGFARFEYGWIEFNTGSFEDLMVATVGVNYYVDGHDLKWTSDVGVAFDVVETIWDASIAGWRADPPGGDPQFVFRTQFQLLY